MGKHLALCTAQSGIRSFTTYVEVLNVFRRAHCVVRECHYVKFTFFSGHIKGENELMGHPIDFCSGSHKLSSFTRRKSRTSNNPVPVLHIPSKYGWMSCSLNESNLTRLRLKLQPYSLGIAYSKNQGIAQDISNPMVCELIYLGQPLPFQVRSN